MDNHTWETVLEAGVWRKHVEALAIEPPGGNTQLNLARFRVLARRKVSMRFVERVGYPMSVSGA